MVAFATILAIFRRVMPSSPTNVGRKGGRESALLAWSAEQALFQGHPTTRRLLSIFEISGLQYYFPQNFRCNLSRYECENFSDSYLNHIFESENFRFPFSTKNIHFSGSELRKIKLQKIEREFIR